jgi:hypothetical protein
MAYSPRAGSSIPPSQRVDRHIPKGPEPIVIAWLEKSPERRPRTAVALLEMLRAFETLQRSSPSEPRNARLRVVN